MAFSRQPMRASEQPLAELNDSQTLLATVALQQFGLDAPRSRSSQQEVEVLLAQALLQDPPSNYAAVFLRASNESAKQQRAAAAVGRSGSKARPQDVVVVVPSALSADMEATASSVIEAIHSALRSQDRLAIVACEDPPSIVLPLATSDVNWNMDNIRALLRVTVADDDGPIADDDDSSIAQRRNAMLCGARKAADIMSKPQSARESSNKRDKRAVIVVPGDASQQRVSQLYTPAPRGMVWKNLSTTPPNASAVAADGDFVEELASLAQAHGVGLTIVAAESGLTCEESIAIARLPACNVLQLPSDDFAGVIRQQLPALLRPVASDLKLRIKAEHCSVAGLHGMGFRWRGGLTSECELEFSTVFAEPDDQQLMRGGVLLLELRQDGMMRSSVRPRLTVSVDSKNDQGRQRHLDMTTELRTDIISPAASWAFLDAEGISSAPPSQNSKPAYFENAAIEKACLLIRCATVLGNYWDFELSLLDRYRASQDAPIASSRMRVDQDRAIDHSFEEDQSDSLLAPGLVWLRRAVDRLVQSSLSSEEGGQGWAPPVWLSQLEVLRSCTLGVGTAVDCPNAVPCDCDPEDLQQALLAAQQMTTELRSLHEHLEAAIVRSEFLRDDQDVTEIRDAIQRLIQLSVERQNFLFRTDALTVPPCLCPARQRRRMLEVTTRTAGATTGSAVAPQPAVMSSDDFGMFSVYL